MFNILSHPNRAGIAALATFFFGFVGILYQRRQKKEVDKKKEKQFHYEVNGLAERFLLVYKSHGIEHAQIPKFVKDAGKLSLADLHSNTSLLKALNENLLSVTCTHFGIQREWLDGGNVPIYSLIYFDKQLEEYIHFLPRLKKEHFHIEGFAIKCPEDKLQQDEPDYDIALLFRGNIKNWHSLEEEPIWR